VKIYPPLVRKVNSLITSVNAALEANENEQLNEAYMTLERVSDYLEVRGLEAVDSTSVLQDILSRLDTIKHLPVLGSEVIELISFLKLANIIQGEGEFNIDEEIEFPLSDFHFKKYSGNDVPFNIFAFFNPSRPENSIGFIVPGGEYSTEELNLSGFSAELLLAIFYFLTREQNLELNCAYIAFRAEAYSQFAAESALKLHAILAGKHVHTEINMEPLSVSNNIIQKIDPLNPYHQFEETLVILSEFNSQLGILSKFMCIYHVIEGFMVKAPLVSLNRQNNGNLFSLRDFKRLFDRLKSHEFESLKDLFTKPDLGELWSVSLETERFDQLVTRNLADLANCPNFSTIDIDNLFMHLGIYNASGYQQFTNNLNAKIYVNMLYKVRCAVVHNKETEHHLSHFNLKPSVAMLIEKVIIEPLYILISELISSPNNTVWHCSSEIKLFERAS
jgi:hypothetical protein